MALMTGTVKVEIKKDGFSASFRDFCTLCGSCYEAGETGLVLLTTSPSARGNVAHSACVRRYNARIEEAELETATLAPPPVATTILDVGDMIQEAARKTAENFRRKYGVELIGEAKRAVWGSYENLQDKYLKQGGARRVDGGWLFADGSLLPDPISDRVF